MVTRCEWAPLDQPRYLAYHDEEWGVPVHDDVRLFEMLTLEGAQAGLSWSTILNKREGYRESFRGFDPAKVARFSPATVERLLQNPAIVRNRLKVESTVQNARAVLEVQRDVGSMALARRSARRDGSLTGDEQGPEAARLPLRGADRLLRLHAGMRAGQRPCRGLLPMGRGAGAALILQLQVVEWSRRARLQPVNSHATDWPPLAGDPDP
jgi:3-methyladenine DNA glycosylase Tag